SIRSINNQSTALNSVALTGATRLEYPSKVFTGHISGVWGVAFSHNGKRVLTGSFDNSAGLWDISGRLVFTTTHPNQVWGVAFSPDGRQLLTGSLDGKVRLWDANNDIAPREVFTAGAGVVSVAFSPDGRDVLAGSTDGEARLWDVISETQILTFTVIGQPG